MYLANFLVVLCMQMTYFCCQHLLLAFSKCYIFVILLLSSMILCLITKKSVCFKVGPLWCRSASAMLLGNKDLQWVTSLSTLASIFSVAWH